MYLPSYTEKSDWTGLAQHSATVTTSLAKPHRLTTGFVTGRKQAMCYSKIHNYNTSYKVDFLSMIMFFFVIGLCK